MTAGGASTVDRVVDIFEAFRHSARPMSLTELAASARIPKSSCHAIAKTLAERGYLYTLARPRAYYPTQRMLDVARAIVACDPFLDHIMLSLQDLRDTSHETVILGKRQGEHALYLHVLEGPHPIRYSAHAGELKPLHSSAVGKALLGAHKEQALRHWAGEQALVRITPQTIVDPELLVADILQGRQNGYFQSRGENVDDVWALAAFFTTGRETFAIGLAGPHHRMQLNMQACAQQLVTTCSLIARKLQRAIPS